MREALDGLYNMHRYIFCGGYSAGDPDEGGPMLRIFQDKARAL